MNMVKKKIIHRQYTFRSKPDENCYDALCRLDKKLSSLMEDRQCWLVRSSQFAISVVERLEQEYRWLIQERNKLIAEANSRHQELLELNPNVITIN